MPERSERAAATRGHGRRISIGFQGGQVLALRVSDGGAEGAVQGARRRRLARARERGRARAPRPRPGRLRARGGRGFRASASAPRTEATAGSGCAACAPWTSAAADRAHARAHARAPSARSRASRRSASTAASGSRSAAPAVALDQRAPQPLARATRGASPAPTLLNTALKLAVRRRRPELRGPAGADSDTPTQLSFPSAHASTSFAGARAVLAPRRCPRRRCMRSRCGLSLSRLYLGVHYPSDVLAGALLGHARSRARREPGSAASTRIGIVGLPNAGKSSLFNALTKAGAEAANYPFTTIEPNVAVVAVRDQRLEEVARVVGASEIVYDTIDFHDIAGLVAGAHQGEGLGNRFLANIRETDAIVHVVRAHARRERGAPRGTRRPARATSRRSRPSSSLADLEQAERRVERVAKQARGGDRAAAAEEAWLREVIDALSAGRPVRTVPVPAEAPQARARPRLADRQAGAVRRQRRRGPPTRCRRRSPRTPPRSPRRRGGDLARASSPSWPSSRTRTRPRCAPSSASASRASSASSAARSRCFDLIAFFTAGEAKPAQSWHLRRGPHRVARGRRDPLRHPERLRARRGDRLARAASTPAATRARANAGPCGSRAATTRCATAT